MNFVTLKNHVSFRELNLNSTDFDHVFLCFLESSSKENLDQTVNSFKKMAGITVLESTSNAEDDVT